MTVSPRYDQYKDAWDTDVLVEVTVLCSSKFSYCVFNNVNSFLK